MQNFEKRKDRFEFFNTFENPLLNLTFTLETEDFLSFCKSQSLPPFHFFLYHVVRALQENENFRYRIYQNEVIKIEELVPSYTVLGKDNLFNYTRLSFNPDLREFIRNSELARNEAMEASKLINTGIEQSERDLKNYVFMTSIPWLDFTSIQHPVFRYKSADIPAVAWGKFHQQDGKIRMPFSLQAHHGFVDAYHMHAVAERIKELISKSIR